MSAKTVVRNVLLIVSVLVASPSAAEDVVLFSYFENNGNSGVYLAYSTDGRTFLPLNNGNVVFTPPQWPNNQVLTRDPSIVFQDGLFHMVWTSDWSGRVFGYASSPDLVSWSTPLQVTPFPVTLPTIDQPINTWAPEIHYDHVQGHFEIVFSSTTPRERDDGDGSTGSDYSNNDHRLYSVRTTDFVTFTPAAKVVGGMTVSPSADTVTRNAPRSVAGFAVVTRASHASASQLKLPRITLGLRSTSGSMILVTITYSTAASTTVMATIRIVAITGDTPRSHFRRMLGPSAALRRRDSYDSGSERPAGDMSAKCPTGAAKRGLRGPL